MPLISDVKFIIHQVMVIRRKESFQDKSRVKDLVQLISK